MLKKYCKKTVVKILKELEEFKVIYQKRQGLGKTNLMFVYKIEEEQECQNKTCKFYSVIIMLSVSMKKN